MLLHMLLFQTGGVQSTLMKHSSRSPSLFRLKVVHKIGEHMIRGFERVQLLTKYLKQFEQFFYQQDFSSES